MNEVTISREEFEMRREHSIQCAKDKKVLRKQVLMLERSVKRHVQEAEDAMLQRDELVTALQGVIAAFCPGPDWAEIPVRKTADAAIDAAMLKTPSDECTQMVDRGTRAWADVPNAAKWVDDLRGGSDDTIETPNAALTGAAKGD